jgi:methionyl-tRNA formyltransferase
VRQTAEDLGLAVRTYRPKERREIATSLQQMQLDVLLVVAFGHILKPALLASARCGAVNVHASLLPRWRGVSPVEQALLAGDAQTGVTLMQLDEGVDTGPILAQRRVDIASDDTRETLLDTLAHEGAALVRQALLPFLAGDITPQPQPEEGACYAPRLDKHMGQLDWKCSAVQLERQVRAYYGWPGCSTVLQGEVVKVHRARARSHASEQPAGTLLSTQEGDVLVVCADGCLQLLEVQFAGKRRAEASELLRTGRLQVGMSFAFPDGEAS